MAVIVAAHQMTKFPVYSHCDQCIVICVILVIIGKTSQWGNLAIYTFAIDFILVGGHDKLSFLFQSARFYGFVNFIGDINIQFSCIYKVYDVTQSWCSQREKQDLKIEYK